MGMGMVGQAGGQMGSNTAALFQMGQQQKEAQQTAQAQAANTWKCPKCGTGDVLIMKTKKGRRFYGCSNHPDCDFVSWQKPDVPVVEEQS